MFCFPWVAVLTGKMRKRRETFYHRDASGEFVPLDHKEDRAVNALKLLRLIESGDVDSIEDLGFKVERPDESETAE